MAGGAHYEFYIALLLVLTSECYLIIGISTFKADTKSPLRRTYFASSLLLFLSSSMYGMLTITDKPLRMRIFWAIGFIAGVMFSPAWLHFLLHLADYRGLHQ